MFHFLMLFAKSSTCSGHGEAMIVSNLKSVASFLLLTFSFHVFELSVGCAWSRLQRWN